MGAAVRLFPDRTKSLAGFLMYTGFFVVAFVVGVQIVVGSIGFLMAPVVSVVGYALSIGVIAATRASWRSWSLASWSIRPWHLVLFIPVVALLVVETFNAFLFPVWEYDSVAYHYPIIRDWFTQQTLWTIPFTAFAGPVGYYPSTGELLTLWPVLLTGSDALVNVPNSLLFLVLIASAFHIAERLNLKKSAPLCVALIAYTPLLWKELGTQHVDLFMTIAFLWSLLFIWEFWRERRPADLALSFAALGLFIGTKYLSLPFAVPLLLVLAHAIVFPYRRFFTTRSLTPLGIGLIASLVLGGFWYVRNAAFTGNPLFPATVEAGPFVLAGYGGHSEAIFGRSILHMLFTLTPTDMLRLARTYVERAGWQSLLIDAALLACVISLCLTRFKQWWKRADAWLAMLVLVYSYCYAAAPNSFGDFDANIRYSLPLLVTGYLLVAVTAERHKRFAFLWGIAAAALIVITIFHTIGRIDLPHDLLSGRLAATYPSMFAMLLTQIMFVILIAWLAYRFGRRTWALPLALSVLVPGALFLNAGLWNDVRAVEVFPSLMQKYPAYVPLLNAEKWLQENAPDASVAFAGFSFVPPLYGPLLERDVFYAPVRACESCTYHEVQSATGGILSGADRDAWMANLRARNAAYLILFNERGYMDPEMEPRWVQELPTVFEAVFEDGEVTVYRTKL